MEQRKDHAALGIDLSEPEFADEALYLVRETNFTTSRGEIQHVLVFLRLGGVSSPGSNPKLILITDQWYRILHSLSYADKEGGFVIGLSTDEEQDRRILCVQAT